MSNNNNEAGVSVAHRCMTQLREHWQNVTITCMSVDIHGQTATLELEWDNEKEDD